MTAAIALVIAYRVAGSLLVLRWRLAGAIAAVAVDLFDLLLLNLLFPGGWEGVLDYQSLDKWLDQVYIGAFLAVAVRDFERLPRRISIALYAWRLAGFLGFEAGLVSRDLLLVFPNLFEFWFIAVAIAMRFRPSFTWTRWRCIVVLAVLLPAKLAQEWAVHVGRLFDDLRFLDVLQSLWRSVTGA